MFLSIKSKINTTEAIKISEDANLLYHVFHIICIILYKITKGSYFVRKNKTTVNIKVETY